jgi:hypothetical protein
MVIVRLVTQNRMVTKGYQKGVYDWVITLTSREREHSYGSGLQGNALRCSPWSVDP